MTRDIVGLISACIVLALFCGCGTSQPIHKKGIQLSADATVDERESEFERLRISPAETIVTMTSEDVPKGVGIAHEIVQVAYFPDGTEASDPISLDKLIGSDPQLLESAERSAKWKVFAYFPLVGCIVAAAAASGFGSGALLSSVLGDDLQTWTLLGAAGGMAAIAVLLVPTFVAVDAIAQNSRLDALNAYNPALRRRLGLPPLEDARDE